MADKWICRASLEAFKSALPAVREWLTYKNHNLELQLQTYVFWTPEIARSDFSLPVNPKTV